MNIPKGTGDYSVNLTIGQMHAFLEDDGAQFESYDEDVDAPDLHDEVLFCPNCERPNQFGELCVTCQREEQEAIDAGERWADEREGNGYPFGTIGAETR